jgi:hypothetical protein
MGSTSRFFEALSARFHGIFFLVSVSASLLIPHMAAAQQPRYEGCTAAQIQSAAAVACGKKLEQDIVKNYTNVHIMRCTGNRMECCIKLGSGGWGGCEPALVAPRDDKSIPIYKRSPATPDVVCASLKSERGEWKPDPRSIKANSDNKTCSQNYVCAAPPTGRLSEDQRKCEAVVTVSNKQVTQPGTCVPGSKPGTCSSCLAKPPNEPCMVSFSK